MLKTKAAQTWKPPPDLFYHKFSRFPLPSGSLCPSGKNLWEKSHSFLGGQIPFLSPNQQCQSTEANIKHWAQLGKTTHCLIHPSSTTGLLREAAAPLRLALWCQNHSTQTYTHHIQASTFHLDRLDRFWMNQDILYNWHAELTGTGSRSIVLC